MSPRDRTGLLLINLGTPESPSPSDVRPYLREFLMDPRVLDVSFLQRWMVVNLFILPFRPKQSGEAYQQVWTDEGSPLLVHSRDLTRKVQQRMGDRVHVELAMRYGNPSIRAGLESLRSRGCDRIVVFPLYPQYSSAANGSSLEKVFEEAGKLWNVPDIQTIPPFWNHPAFIRSCVEVARPYVEGSDAEKVFFSFHGLPERQVIKSDDTGRHCLQSDDCCARVGQANRNCYRAQCYDTARLLADALGIEEERRVVCFQSRLGRTPWIRPYTDVLLAEEAQGGCRKALILSPAFVADCLETIEELGMRGVETWRENGGEELRLVPCINATDSWADGVVEIVREHSSWLAETPVGAPGAARGGS